MLEANVQVAVVCSFCCSSQYKDFLPPLNNGWVGAWNLACTHFPRQNVNWNDSEPELSDDLNMAGGSVATVMTVATLAGGEVLSAHFTG